MTPHSDEVTAPHADEELDEQPLLVLGIGAPAGSLDPLLQVIRGGQCRKRPLYTYRAAHGAGSKKPDA